MQGRDDIAGFVKAFAGSHVYVAEYLVAAHSILPYTLSTAYRSQGQYEKVSVKHESAAPAIPDKLMLLVYLLTSLASPLW